MIRRLISLSILAILLCFTACNSDKAGDTNPLPKQVTDAPAATENVEEVDENNADKIVIITNAVTSTGVNDYFQDEFYSAQLMVKKYPNRVIHEVWPDGEWNDLEKLESMKLVAERIATDTEIKACVINSTIYGTNLVVDKLHETRNDILVIYCYSAEEPKESAERADIIMLPNEVKIGFDIARLAYEAGAKTFVHYSFQFHLDRYTMLAARFDILKAECERLGMDFVYAEVPNPLVDRGGFQQQFMLVDVSRKVTQYGKNTAFFSTLCITQSSLIEACINEGAIYPSPCCPSPYHGYPAALELDGFHQIISDNTNYTIIDNPAQIVESEFRRTTIEQINQKIVDANLCGHFSTWPFQSDILNTYAAVDYAFKWIAGETNGKTDINVMRECLESYTGPGVDIEPYVENGVTYDNFFLYMQPYITFK